MKQKNLKPDSNIENVVNSKNKQEDLNLEVEKSRQLKKPVSSAPTWTPKNNYEASWPYENGATLRMYYYISGSWYYSTLS